MTEQIKLGSKWGSVDKTFVVIGVVEQLGHIWIHYREDIGPEPKEYSCYMESFVSRFRPLPE